MELLRVEQCQAAIFHAIPSTSLQISILSFCKYIRLVFLLPANEEKSSKIVSPLFSFTRRVFK